MTITQTTAQQLLSLYDTIEAADAIFKPCQNTLFRQQVKAAYEAENVAKAFEEVRSKLKAAEPKQSEPKPKAAASVEKAEKEQEKEQGNG